MTKNRAIVLTIISALIYGFTPVLCSMTYEYGNNPYSLTFFRSLLVLPVLAVLLIKNKISLRLNKDEFIKMMIIGLFGAVFTTLLLYSSYTYIGVGTATTLHFMYPLFVLVICHFIYRDHITTRQYISLALAMIGIVCFIDFNDFSRIQGIAMALISGVTFAVYLVGIEKAGLSSMNNYKLSFYLSAIVSVSLLVFNIFSNQIVFNQPVSNYFLMVCIGLLASFIALIFLKIGIEELGSTLASMFCLFEPISSVVFGFFLLNESVGFMKILGCLFIIVAMALLVMKKKKA
ncbi:DMT family transporter [Anaerorhabdus sp.]|uniref:DMT family transporter n=1 Tax=Anaerorhabdus sp. TaxID=1872524 RepID=UPI002B203EC7|nr:DMT family transporter [Anaerorhabdus sp.]MEA4875841.1 DMT family transporter [Anaerorhabdus sp.]